MSTDVANAKTDEAREGKPARRASDCSAALRAYACRLRGSEHETIYHDRSPGKAKRRFFVDLDMQCIEYTDIRVRVAGEPQTTDGIRRTAEYRGVPFVRAGMRVQVDGDWGVIVGHNDSANWDVLFDDDSRYKGQVLNCHPMWEIAYYDNSGEIIRDFRKSAA
jgi:hypothetical protein